MNRHSPALRLAHNVKNCYDMQLKKYDFFFIFLLFSPICFFLPNFFLKIFSFLIEIVWILSELFYIKESYSEEKRGQFFLQMLTVRLNISLTGRYMFFLHLLVIVIVINASPCILESSRFMDFWFMCLSAILTRSKTIDILIPPSSLYLHDWQISWDIATRKQKTSAHTGNRNINQTNLQTSSQAR